MTPFTHVLLASTVLVTSMREVRIGFVDILESRGNVPH